LEKILTDLHTPLIPILRHVLALAPLPRTGVALDLACGPGLKAPLLAAACGPGVRLVGIDVDRAAIRGAIADCRLQIADYGTRDTQHATRNAQHVTCIVGDALALPLRDGCCAAAFCIAALSLFADCRVALRELRRALAPGGVALLVVGAQAWAQTIRWPAELSARMAAAYTQSLADGIAPLPASLDLGGDLAALLIDVGFAAPLVRAFRLDRPPTIEDSCNTQHATRNTQPPRGYATRSTRSATDYRPQTTDSPLASELPLIPWPALRPLLAGRLASAELERCDALAADPEIELCALALVAQTRAA
jgi:SAM-dependent methyltransferase